MTEAQIQELQLANQESERLHQAHMLSQAGVCLEAFLLVTLYPNDERLTHLRKHVAVEEACKKQYLDHVSSLGALVGA